MKPIIKSAFAAGALALGTVALAVPATAQTDDAGMFIVRALDHPPQEASALVRSFTEMDDDWLFLANSAWQAAG